MMDQVAATERLAELSSRWDLSALRGLHESRYGRSRHTRNPVYVLEWGEIEEFTSVALAYVRLVHREHGHEVTEEQLKDVERLEWFLEEALRLGRAGAKSFVGDVERALGVVASVLLTERYPKVVLDDVRSTSTVAFDDARVLRTAEFIAAQTGWFSGG